MSKYLSAVDVQIAKSLGVNLDLLAKQSEVDALIAEAAQQRKIAPGSEESWRAFGLKDFVAFKAQLDMIPAGSAPAIIQ